MKTQLIAVLVAIACVAAEAQDIQVQIATEEPPHYVGVGAIVQLTVEGLEAEPEPKCTIEASAKEIRARLSGISPRIMQQMFQSGNQIRRIQRVTHTIQFRVTASKPGEYEIGPFLISQNGTEKRVEPIKMSFQEVPTTDDMRIKLIMPETAYPDQRVPVKIEWWFAGDTENINDLNIESPLFDDFRFAPDPPAPRGKSRIPIQTSQGMISLPATARVELSNGKQFTVVTGERTLIPNRPGEFEIAPITATIELVTEWERRRRSAFDDFGFGSSLFDEAFGSGRRAAKVELFRAEDEPFSFQVKPFPSENRPQSFSGAVGKGFSLEVAADRTVVRVGDPIRLTLKLRGDGNIEGAALPSLSADGGLDPERFRLPEGDVAGAFDDKQHSKQFTVSVRVLDESISEIPAIAYSWFDVDKEAYQTTRSKPIALRVMPAQVVGAESVVTNQRGKSPGGQQASNADTETPTQRTARTFSLSGADLAIERDPGRLIVGSTSLLANKSFQLAGYTLGSLCLLIAFVDRRRRQVDPAVRKAAAAIRAQRSRISAAAQLPVKEAAKQIADALQAAAAEFPEADRSTIHALMSECESIAYKPSGNEQTRIEQDLIERALAAIVELKAQPEST